ncbi:hypothetical protein MZK49_28365 [Ensifer sesbaniae]|uniref:hypothetical protein n=1 Tax=Ensifer sesbaniae TaxID=1214071 RepID=UPI00156913A1|nr:hypothetical protein [Ensifer sesbaniae]MCK3780597.1 hypothetical protein [Ensifer sesbaniae]
MRRSAVILPPFEICGFNLPRGAQPIPALQFGKQGLCRGYAGLRPPDKEASGKTKVILIIDLNALMKPGALQYAIQHCQVGGSQEIPVYG